MLVNLKQNKLAKMTKEYKTFSEIKGNKTLCDNMITAYNHGRKYGWTQKEVAEEYGVSTYALRKVFDESDRAIFSKRVYAEDLQLIMQQHQSGMKINSIAGYHGLSESTIKKYINLNKNSTIIQAEIYQPRLAQAAGAEIPETAETSTPAAENKTNRIGGNNLERRAELGEGNNWSIQPNAGYSVLRTLVTALVGVGLFIGGLAVGTKINTHKAYNQGNKAGYSLGYNDGYNNCVKNGEKCHKHKTHAQPVPKQKGKSVYQPSSAQATGVVAPKQNGKSECHDTQSKNKIEIKQKENCFVIGQKTNQTEQQGGTVTVTYEHPRIIVPEQARSLEQVKSLDAALRVKCGDKIVYPTELHPANLFLNSYSIGKAGKGFLNRIYSQSIGSASEGAKIFGNDKVVNVYELKSGFTFYDLPNDLTKNCGNKVIWDVAGVNFNGIPYVNDNKIFNDKIKSPIATPNYQISFPELVKRLQAAEQKKKVIRQQDQPGKPNVPDGWLVRNQHELWVGPADLGPTSTEMEHENGKKDDGKAYGCPERGNLNKAVGIGILEGVIIGSGISQINGGGVLSNLGSWTEGPVGVGAAIVAP